MPADQIICVGTASRDDWCGKNGVNIPSSAITKANLLDVLVATSKPVLDGELVIGIDLKAQILANAVKRKFGRIDACTKRNDICSRIAKIIDDVLAITKLEKISVTKPDIGSLQQVIATAAGECTAGTDGVVAGPTHKGVDTGVICDQVVALTAIDDVVADGTIQRVVAAATFKGIDTMPADQIICVGTASRDDWCGKNGVNIPSSAITKANLLDVLVATSKPVLDGELVIGIDLKAQILANAVKRKFGRIDACTKRNDICSRIAKIIDDVLAITKLEKISVTKPDIGSLQQVIATAAGECTAGTDGVVT